MAKDGGGAGAAPSADAGSCASRADARNATRHRYQANVHYKDALEQGGLVFSGMSPDRALPEIVEQPDHPFVGVQFHPELKSKPFEPHPLFASPIQAAVKQSPTV